MTRAAHSGLRQALAAALEEHRRQCPERGSVIDLLIELAASPGDPLSRNQLEPGHFTASAFVLSADGSRLLLIHHPKLRRWLQPGGHIEPEDADCEAAARREVLEETGVAQLELLGSGIFDVDVHAIPARLTEGAHRHFDVRYAFRAQEDGLRVSSEVEAARWVPLERVVELNPEESLLRPVRRLTGFPLLRTRGAR
jgi:8-oxo-dGTP pyrophosphatase MutT (NUDIX family)